MKLQPSVHALTIDVEDWYTGIPLENSTRDNCEHRLRRQMDVLLRMLEDHGAKGTFFWVGELADEYPDLVRSVESGGHRTGCHGYLHRMVEEVDPEHIRTDIRRAKDTLQDITGSEVISYRAPFFSIDRDHLWMLDLLAELGFRVDSSIFPVWNWRYGIPFFPDRIQSVLTGRGRIWLAPISVRGLPGLRIPISGGAYFRIYPYSLTRSNIRSCERKGRFAVFYIHPWELDPEQPRVRFDLRARLTHYANLATCGDKFDRLLSEFSFITLEDVVDLQRALKGRGRSPEAGLPPSSAGTFRHGAEVDYLLDCRSQHQTMSLKHPGTYEAVVLDIGTRDGVLLERALRDRDVSCAVGLDIDSEHMRTAAGNGRVRFVQADAEFIPVRDGSIDLVMCSSTYKHIWDVRGVLAECFRVLKPGGLLSLVIVTPFGIRLGRLFGHFCKGTIRRTSDIADVCRECSESGFTVITTDRSALPFRVPGGGKVESIAKRIGLGRLLFYQFILARAEGSDVSSEQGV